jgi:hypothetical protein
MGAIPYVQLGKDVVNVIADRLWANAKCHCDLGISQSGCHQVEDVPFALSHFVKPGEHFGRFASMTSQECCDLIEKLSPCRLMLKQDVITARQRHKFGTVDRARNLASLLEWDSSIVV